MWGRISTEIPDVLFMLDSGSEASLINRKVYDEIPEEQRPPLLNEKPNLVTASEQKLSIYGKVVIQVTVRDLVFDHAFWVSDMIEDGIFGVDMLRAQSAQVDFKRAKLYMRGKSIAIQTSRGRPIHTKVIAIKQVCIPPSTECVMTGKICATKRHQEEGPSQALLEPAQLFYQKTGGIICKELVNAANPTVPVRVYNPCKYTVVVPAHMTLGVLSEVLEVKVHTDTKPTPKPKKKRNPRHRKRHTRIQQVQHLTGEYVEDYSNEAWMQNLQSQVEQAEDILPEHMQDLYERSVEGLPQSDHSKVAKLLLNNSDVFASHKSDLGRTHLVKHSIKTGDEPPVRDHPRRLPMAQTAEVHKQVRALHEQGIISPSNGEWASNIVMVKKKDGLWRMCVDYRELNAKTKNQDPYMLPRIDETLDRLNNAKYFSTLDLLMGYHQVELEEDSKDATGFQVPKMYPSHWKFDYMPFGLMGAPRTFQRLIDQLLSNLPPDIAMAYLDDIIVMSQTIDDGIKRLEAVFDQLRLAGLKLKAKKCELFRTSVLYLGHIVSAEGIRTDPAKVTAILAWRAPRTAKQTKRFLATVSYYRRFIPNFSGIAEPLINLQRKRVGFKWLPECQEAFEFLRTCLVTAPVLAYPADEGLYILDTDASEHSISGALSQMQPNDKGELVERMIANASKTLNTAERRYCVRRREMKAIVQFARHFRPYLYGRKVLFRTDHASLRYIQTMRNGSDQFHRWMEVLSEFDYTIEIRKGALHVNADGLSRLGCNGKQCVCAQVDKFERTPGIVNNHNVVCSVTTASSLFCVTGIDGERRMREVESSDSGQSSASESRGAAAVRVNVVQEVEDKREMPFDEWTEEWLDRVRHQRVDPRLAGRAIGRARGPPNRNRNLPMETPWQRAVREREDEEREREKRRKDRKEKKKQEKEGQHGADYWGRMRVRDGDREDEGEEDTGVASGRTNRESLLGWERHGQYPEYRREPNSDGSMPIGSVLDGTGAPPNTSASHASSETGCRPKTRSLANADTQRYDWRQKPISSSEESYEGIEAPPRPRFRRRPRTNGIRIRQTDESSSDRPTGERRRQDAESGEWVAARDRPRNAWYDQLSQNRQERKKSKEMERRHKKNEEFWASQMKKARESSQQKREDAKQEKRKSQEKEEAEAFLSAKRMEEESRAANVRRNEEYRRRQEKTRNMRGTISEPEMAGRMSLRERLTLPNSRAIVNTPVVMMTPEEIRRSEEYERTGRIVAPVPRRQRQAHRGRYVPPHLRQSLSVGHTSLQHSHDWPSEISDTSEMEFDPVLTSSPSNIAKRRRMTAKRRKLNKISTGVHHQTRSASRKQKAKTDPRQTSGEEAESSDEPETSSRCKPYTPSRKREDDDDERRLSPRSIFNSFNTRALRNMNKAKAKAGDQKTTTSEKKPVEKSQAVDEYGSDAELSEIENRIQKIRNPLPTMHNPEGKKVLTPIGREKRVDCTVRQSESGEEPEHDKADKSAQDKGFIIEWPIRTAGKRSEHLSPRSRRQLLLPEPTEARVPECVDPVVHYYTDDTSVMSRYRNYKTQYPIYLPPHRRGKLPTNNGVFRRSDQSAFHSYEPENPSKFKGVTADESKQTVKAISTTGGVPAVELNSSVMAPGKTGKVTTAEAKNPVTAIRKTGPEDRFDRIVKVWSGDIATLRVDAIVNAANTTLLGGGGVDGAIHLAAGPSLREECRVLEGCKPGDAKITNGYRLPAKHVIHTVGPKGYQPAMLASCYDHCLRLFKLHSLHSIAFPCISTGAYGFPREPACRIALSRIQKFLQEEPNMKIDRIILCTYLPVDEEIYQRTLPEYFSLSATGDIPTRTPIGSAEEIPSAKLKAKQQEANEKTKVTTRQNQKRNRRKHKVPELVTFDTTDSDEDNVVIINEVALMPSKTAKQRKWKQKTLRYHRRQEAKKIQLPSQLETDPERTKKRIETVNLRSKAMELLHRIRMTWVKAIREFSSLNKDNIRRSRPEQLKHDQRVEICQQHMEETQADYNQQAQYIRWLATMMTNVLSEDRYSSERSITMKGKPVEEDRYPASADDENRRQNQSKVAPVTYSDYTAALRIYRLQYIYKQRELSSRHLQLDKITKMQVEARERSILAELERHRNFPGDQERIASNHAPNPPNTQEYHYQLTRNRMELRMLNQQCQAHTQRLNYLNELAEQLQSGSSYVEPNDVKDMLFPIALRPHQDLIITWEKEEVNRLAKKVEEMTVSLRETSNQRKAATEKLGRLQTQSLKRTGAYEVGELPQLDGPDPEAVDEETQRSLEQSIDDCARRIAATVRDLNDTESSMESLLSRQEQIDKAERENVLFAFGNDLAQSNDRDRVAVTAHRRQVRTLANRRRQMRWTTEESSDDEITPARFPESYSSDYRGSTSAEVGIRNNRKRKLTIPEGVSGHKYRPIILSSSSSSESDTEVHDMSDLTQTPMVKKERVERRLRFEEREEREEEKRRQEDDAQVDAWASDSYTSDEEEEEEDKDLNKDTTTADEDKDEDDDSDQNGQREFAGSTQAFTPHNDVASTSGSPSEGSYNVMEEEVSGRQEKIMETSSTERTEDHTKVVLVPESKETLPVETDDMEEAREAGISLLSTLRPEQWQDTMKAEGSQAVHQPRPYTGTINKMIEPSELKRQEQAWDRYSHNQKTQSTDGTIMSVRKVVDYLQQHDIDEKSGSLTHSNVETPKSLAELSTEKIEEEKKQQEESDICRIQMVRQKNVESVHPCQNWREDHRIIATSGEDSSESIFQSTERLSANHARVKSLIEQVRPHQEEAFQQVWMKTIRQVEQLRSNNEADMVVEDMIDDAVEIPDLTGVLKIRAVTFGSWWTAAEMRQQQEGDIDIGPVASIKFSGDNHPGPKWFANCSAATQALAREWDRLIVHCGVLYRKWESGDGQVTRLQLVLPHQHHSHVLALLHDECTAGHLGVQKTLYRVQLRYYWYKMIEDVRRYIQMCEACQRRKNLNPAPKAPMKIYQTGVPFQRIAMDLCGPICETPRANKIVLVISDYFTKYTMLIPVVDKTTVVVATALATQWIVLWGCPQYIHTDQGLEFESGLIHELCRRFGIHKTKTTAYHPQSDGMVERFNKTMMQIVSTLCENYVDWDLHLPFAQMAYNSTVHATTGETPNKIVQGRHLHMPLDVITQLDADDEDVVAQHEYVKELEEKLRITHDVVRQHTAKSMSKQKYYHDRGVNYNDYQEDDLVLLKVEAFEPYVGKLSDRYEGPYVIVERRLNDTFLLQQEEGSRAITVQHNRLKPYFTTREYDMAWVQEVRNKLQMNRAVPVEIGSDISTDKEQKMLTTLENVKLDRSKEDGAILHVLGTEAESTDGSFTTVTGYETSHNLSEARSISYPEDDSQVANKFPQCDKYGSTYAETTNESRSAPSLHVDWRDDSIYESNHDELEVEPTAKTGDRSLPRIIDFKDIGAEEQSEVEKTSIAAYQASGEEEIESNSVQHDTLEQEEEDVDRVELVNENTTGVVTVDDSVEVISQPQATASQINTTDIFKDEDTPVVRKRVGITFIGSDVMPEQSIQPRISNQRRKRKLEYEWREVDSDTHSEKIAKLVPATDAIHNTRFRRRQTTQ